MAKTLHINICFCSVVWLIPSSYLRLLLVSCATTKRTNHYTKRLIFFVTTRIRPNKGFQSNGWKGNNTCSWRKCTHYCCAIKNNLWFHYRLRVLVIKLLWHWDFTDSLLPSSTINRKRVSSISSNWSWPLWFDLSRYIKQTSNTSVMIWKLSTARISFTDTSSVYFASQYLLRQVPLMPWGPRVSHFTHIAIAKYD